MPFQGRSKSLTSIDALNPLSAMNIDVDCKSETDVTGGMAGADNRLMVPSRSESATPGQGGGVGGGGQGGTNRAGSPGAGYQRRRKLSTAGKVKHPCQLLNN